MTDIPVLFAGFEPIPEAPPPQPDLFIIVAALEGGTTYTVPANGRGPWLSRQAAQEHAAKLASCWRWRRVYCLSEKGATDGNQNLSD